MYQKNEIRYINPDKVQLLSYNTNEIIEYRYATFGERFLARFLDVLIITIPQFCIPVIPSWLYWALQQSAEKQQTVGQSAMKIQLLSTDGEKIDFGQATGRFFADFLNIFTLFIGYFVFFTSERKQCLHDNLSNVIVVFELSRTTLEEEQKRIL